MVYFMSLTFLLISAILLSKRSQGAQFPDSELSALEDLFDATSGSGWLWKNETFGARWNFTSDANPCVDDWQGITCFLPSPFDNYYVSVLQLDQYNLIGQLPTTVDQLTQLTNLNLGANNLTGPIPHSIGNLNQLKYLNLSYNFLSQSIPQEIGSLPNLEELLLNNNQLDGSLPASFSQMQNLRQLMLQFNKLVGPTQQAFNSSQQLSLSYVSLNNNQFSEHLPESLLSNTNLRSIYLDNNCFSGNLTNSVCGNSQLQVLSLGCLHSASQCVRYPFKPISNTFTLTNPVQGTIPACILEIPSLQLLNLAGNALSGGLSNNIHLSSNLSNINLMYNHLSGTLPRVLQEHPLQDLYLSHNHFTGSLVSQSTTFAPDQFWDLTYNRLSGTVPSAVRTADSVNILTGNLFSCLIDKTDLPRNDHGRLNYECGSNGLNTPYLTWTAMITATTVLFICAYYRKDKLTYIDIQGCFVTARAWLLCTRQVKSPSLQRVRQVAKHVIFMACICASALNLVGLPAYAALKSYYGTYRMQYMWTIAFVLLKGTTPFVLGFLMFVLTILLFAALYTTHNKHTKNAMREKFQVCAETPSLEIVCLCAAFFMIHLTVSLTVNIVYVYVVIRLPDSLEFAISLYKMFWNGVCAPRLSRYMLQRLHMSSADLFSLELYVSLMNNVIVPVLAIVLIHPRCLFGVFVHNARYSSSFNDVEMLYVFPFRYNYQCSFEYMKHYSAAFIYLAIFTAFGLPVYELTLLFLYKRATPGTNWYRGLSYMLPRILKPLTTDSVPTNDISNPVFDGTKFLVALLTCLALILSLGVVSPLQAGCLAICMVFTCGYSILKVGRYLHQVQKTPHAAHYIESIEVDSRGVVNNIMLRKSFWLLFFLSCWFMSPFLFDAYGARVGFERSYWVLLAVPLFPWAVFLIFRTTRTQVVWDFLTDKCTISAGWTVETDCGEDGKSGEAGDIPGGSIIDTGSIGGFELCVVHNTLLENRSEVNIDSTNNSDLQRVEEGVKV